MRKFLVFLTFIVISVSSNASMILIPMDDSQSNHLKAYGLSYYLLENDIVIDWLLNYRGGAFLTPHMISIEEELIIANT